MMTEGIVEKDGGIEITTGITTDVIVTETIGGGEVVTALIMTTGDGETIATIAITGIIGIAGTIAGNDQRIRSIKNQATRLN
jgi:hypothetical protein